MRKQRSIPNNFLILFSFILLAGCNQNFEPLQENDKYFFSIYGYLDASADTQWVRVGQIRENINGLADPSKISVTLEHIQNGTSVVMNDSLFATENVLNYWSTFDIENEQTYRIKVENPEGETSRVVVTIPKELPTPIVFAHNYQPFGFSVYIDDSVGHIADVQSRWYVLLNPDTERTKRTYSFAYRDEIEYTEVYDGQFTVFAPLDDEEERIESNFGDSDFEVVHRQFFVAVAGPEWDENISSIDDLEYFVNETSSNVVNGLGYVIGIDSKWVPYRACVSDSGSIAAPCPEEDPFW